MARTEMTTIASSPTSSEALQHDDASSTNKHFGGTAIKASKLKEVRTCQATRSEQAVLEMRLGMMMILVLGGG
jgi:hypothetical protein